MSFSFLRALPTGGLRPRRPDERYSIRWTPGPDHLGPLGHISRNLWPVLLVSQHGGNWGDGLAVDG